MPNREQINKLLGLEINSANPVYVFSEHESPRLEYVCRFIFNHVLKVQFKIYLNEAQFCSLTGIKINYSKKQISSVLQITPAGLVFENKISEEKPPVDLYDNSFRLFPTQDGDLKFDIFSAVFYMISRYEEWQNFKKDIHGRFELFESILYKNHMHLKPVTDMWIVELKHLIEKTYGVQICYNEFKTIATIDVDNLFAYGNKGFFRTFGAGFKDLIKSDNENRKRRKAVLSGKEKDPFDIYESFTKYCKDLNIPLIYFFLFKTGTKYDRTVNPASSAFEKVFETIKKHGGLTGLHPSYFSSDEEQKLVSETEQFSAKLKARVTLSRQHYLKFDIKKTPLQLLKQGILADFTMGFASGAGFRAGTSFPFNYYNFAQEKELDFLFVPFCAMDGAYFVYDNISPEETLSALNKLKEEVKEVNGLFITVFHERTFAGHLYPGFGDMYRQLLATN